MEGGELAATVSAIVVNRDAGEALLECVASLRKAGVTDVVVVDNASSDGSLARLADADRSARLVPSGANLGYGRAVNLGAKRAVGETLLILNPDVVVEPDAVRTLAQALRDEPDLGVVGPRIANPDGSRYPSARAFPHLGDAAGHALVSLVRPDNAFTRRYQLRELDWETEADVDWVSGACMAVRRDAFVSVGGFDEAYFMYVEDLDLCWRLGRAAWRVRYVPGARVTHVGGVSARRHPYAMLVAHHRSALRFYARSASGPERALVPLAAGALGVRLAGAVAMAAAKSLRSGRSSPPEAVD